MLQYHSHMFLPLCKSGCKSGTQGKTGPWRGGGENSDRPQLPPPRSFWEARVSWSGCPFERQSRQPLKPCLQGGPEQAFRGGCVCDSLPVYCTVRLQHYTAPRQEITHILWDLGTCLCFTVPGSQGQRLGAGSTSPSVACALRSHSAKEGCLRSSLVSVLCPFSFLWR